MARASGTLLLLAYVAFVSLGLPDAVLGVAWPSIRDGFDVPQAFLGIPLAISAASYFLSGLLAGRLMDGLGIGRLLALSTALVTVGVIGFAIAPVFALFALAAPLVGFGSGAIDSALNTYAARNFTAKHMSWLHAAYAAGAMSGPAIMTAVLALGGSWRIGYGTVGAALALLVPVFVAVRRRWEPSRADTPEPAGSDRGGQANAGPQPTMEAPASTWSALRSGRVWLQIALFFAYTGVEATAGQWSYTLLTEERGFASAAAGTWVSLYWGGLLAGRVVLGAIVERLGQARLLRLATFGALASAVVFAIPGFEPGVVALPVLSFSLASIYPGLMSETPRRVGERLAAHSVGFQVSAATLGIALIPSAAGVLAERSDLSAIGWVIVGCALVLVLLHERLVATTDRAAGVR